MYNGPVGASAAICSVVNKSGALHMCTSMDHVLFSLFACLKIPIFHPHTASSLPALRLLFLH